MEELGFNCPPRIFQAESSEEWVRCRTLRHRRYVLISVAILVVITIIFIAFGTWKEAAIVGAVGLGICGAIYLFGRSVPATARREWTQLEREVNLITEDGKRSRADALIEIERRQLDRQAISAQRSGWRSRWGYRQPALFNIRF